MTSTYFIIQVLTVKDVVKGADGSITKIVGSVVQVDKANKPKAWIQWVSSSYGNPFCPSVPRAFS